MLRAEWQPPKNPRAQLQFQQRSCNVSGNLLRYAHSVRLNLRSRPVQTVRTTGGDTVFDRTGSTRVWLTNVDALACLWASHYRGKLSTAGPVTVATPKNTLVMRSLQLFGKSAQISPRTWSGPSGPKVYGHR